MTLLLQMLVSKRGWDKSIYKNEKTNFTWCTLPASEIYFAHPKGGWWASDVQIFTVGRAVRSPRTY